ncbi:MAG: hypothetical protein NZ556_06260 [Fimbriimonadales bacterium]|nr:hypothetical protein [Fimbriimonadales bacterium]
MSLFWDTDVLLKLAAMDLLSETLQIFGVSIESVYLLPSVLPYLDKKSSLQSRYSAKGVRRAIRFAQQAQVVQSYDNAELEILSEIQGLDSGEALLIAATGSVAEPFWLLMGDKRALRALRGSISCARIAARLSGKVICLEQIVLRVVQRDFAKAREKIAPARECDIAIKVAFGSGLEATPENVERALRSYIEDLRRETAGLLVDW